MKIVVQFAILWISATYAVEKITKRGVFSENSSIGVGSLPIPHFHGHGNNLHHIEDEPHTEIGPALAAPAIEVPALPISAISANPTAIAGSGLALGIGSSAINSGAGLGAPGAIALGTVIDLGSVVQQHIHVTNRVGIPIEQPYPVQIERRIPISVPHPVDVPVDRPYPVRVPVKYVVKITKNIAVPVEKPVPVAVRVPVRVPVEVPYKVFHPHPVAVPVEQAVPVPVPDPVIVKRPVPVAVHAHLEPLHLNHVDHHH